VPPERLLEEFAEPGAIGAEARTSRCSQERLGVHYFTCAARAYPGWRWAVSVARVPRGKVATVCETTLVPAEGAHSSRPPWVPYADRLAPGDLGPGDTTAYVADDPLLEAGFEATGDEDVDRLALWELGLGRLRVLSAEGREVAASRWYAGAAGPSDPVAVKAPARCASCGFFVPMAGALRAVFGVCANEWSPSDGRVVALDHGCGAHSEVDVDQVEPERIPPPIIDDFRLDLA
jgi:hypothetical protein